MKSLTNLMLTLIYSFLGFSMMIPFVISFMKEELLKKINSKRGIVTAGN